MQKNHQELPWLKRREIREIREAVDGGWLKIDELRVRENEKKTQNNEEETPGKPRAASSSKQKRCYFIFFPMTCHASAPVMAKVG